MNMNSFNKQKFSNLLAKTLESLSYLQLMVYNLHLLGWMNEEIADELQMRKDQVSIALYQARQKVKKSLSEDGIPTASIHQNIAELQKLDMDLLSQTFISRRSILCSNKEMEASEGDLGAISKIGKIKDSCIKAGQIGKNIFRVAELISSGLSEEDRNELLEQLEEYRAAQEGLGKSAPDGVRLDAVWEKALASVFQNKEIANVFYATSMYATLVATYILSRPFVRRGPRGAPAKNILEGKSDDLLWEIYQEKTKLIFSMAAKSEELIGKYVVLSITSAKKVKYLPGSLQWKQEGPENIGSEKPIGSGKRVEFVIAETKFDMDNDEDFELLQQIFEEIELKVFEEKSQE